MLEFRCGWVGVVSVLQAEACKTGLRKERRGGGREGGRNEGREGGRKE